MALALASLPLIYLMNVPRVAPRRRKACNALLLAECVPIGLLYIAAALGLFELPASLLFSARGKLDKLAYGAESLGISAPLLLLLLGACRLATAYSFIKGKKEIAAEQLISAVYLATLYVHHMTADKLAIPALLLGATLCMVEMDNASSRYYLTKEAVAFDLDSLAQRLGSGRAGNIAKEGGAE